MACLVRLRGPLRRQAGDRAGLELDGATVAELLAALERACPGLEGWVRDERGAVRRHINVFVNGERAPAHAAVADGDTVDVLPAISGGAP